MYRTILLPLDGSTFAELALPMAVTLAQSMNARLVLVRATGALVPANISPAQAQAEAQWEAERYLTRVARQLTGQGVPVETAIQYLPPCEGILQECESQAADLIVMCTHARSGLGKSLYGSVADGVLRESRVPVMLLRPEDASARIPVLKGSCVLVPLDGFALGETALAHACTLARVLEARLVLLRVVPIPRYAAGLTVGFSVMDQLLSMEQADAEQYLVQVSESLTLAGIKVESRTRSGGVVSGIAEEAETCNASMIVMAAQGRGRVNDLIMGDIAQGVMEWSSRPLLLVPPQQASYL